MASVAVRPASRGPLVLLEIDCRWSAHDLDCALPLLPASIQKRAARYLSLESRRNLIASRYRLQQALEILGLEAAKVQVAANGRPFYLDHRLQFNITHSHERAVLALSSDHALHEGLGVDLEWTQRRLDVVSVGRRFFTAEEHRWVGVDPHRFFHIWTRKEAILKSNGIGLRVALDSFEVLSDQVPEHVTGRSLTMTTRPIGDGYLLSWATCAVPPEVILLSDRDPEWADKLGRAVGCGYSGMGLD